MEVMGRQLHVIKTLVYSLLLFFVLFAAFPIGELYAKQPRTIFFPSITFSESQVVHQFTEGDLIYGLSISSFLQFHGDNSLVRVILVGDDLHEYLVYEAYPLISDSNNLHITDMCEETCFLDGIVPSLLKIEMINASLQINEVSIVEHFSSSEMKATDSQKVKIKKLNENIKKKGLKWTAGETSLSQLSYEEKKKWFGGKVPNLQGGEYYKGGIFEIMSPNSTTSSPPPTGSSVVESFDWRNRHGANIPGSLYYDLDILGTGWITSVKKRGGCGSCWAFSAIGATEALVNLYFNQHINLNLSEQEILSCSGAGDCGGGWPRDALQYITDNGVVDEKCFPYTQSDDEPCNKCSDPRDVIKIAGREDSHGGATEEDIKRDLIDYGPLNFAIISWRHSMVLVGYEKDPTDGKTVWILKNDVGTSWGENGFGKIKVDFSDMYEVYRLLTPVTSLVSHYAIACNDFDNDGYYNWGISKNKPSSCPQDAPSEPDCDDWNSNLTIFSDNGGCLYENEETCEGYCGEQSPSGCWCDDQCVNYGDCCETVCDDCPTLSHCQQGGNCQGFCGGQSRAGCWCDDLCERYGDCCETVCDDCPTLSHCVVFCQGICGNEHPSGCWCDDLCERYGDCCSDYDYYCGG